MPTKINGSALPWKVIEQASGSHGIESANGSIVALCHDIVDANRIVDAANALDNDTPSAGPADLDEIAEVTRNLIDAAKLVAERWESGNLADAVQNLQMTASFAEYTLENVTVEVEPLSKNVTSWDYHQHGQHAYFTTEEWHTDVAESGTILGYQAWVEQKLEEMLHETDLVGIDSIEIAGCTEHDGIVEVITEGDAEFFSVYTHRQNMGVECICDFNNKAQALEFAKALAGRAGLPIYGNQCSIEEEISHVE